MPCTSADETFDGTREKERERENGVLGASMLARRVVNQKECPHSPLTWQTGRPTRGIVYFTGTHHRCYVTYDGEGGFIISPFAADIFSRMTSPLMNPG